MRRAWPAERPLPAPRSVLVSDPGRKRDCRQIGETLYLLFSSCILLVWSDLAPRFTAELAEPPASALVQDSSRVKAFSVEPAHLPATVLARQIPERPTCSPQPPAASQAPRSPTPAARSSPDRRRSPCPAPPCKRQFLHLLQELQLQLAEVDRPRQLAGRRDGRQVSAADHEHGEHRQPPVPSRWTRVSASQNPNNSHGTFASSGVSVDMLSMGALFHRDEPPRSD